MDIYSNKALKHYLHRTLSVSEPIVIEVIQKVAPQFLQQGHSALIKINHASEITNQKLRYRFQQASFSGNLYFFSPNTQLDSDIYELNRLINNTFRQFKDEDQALIAKVIKRRLTPFGSFEDVFKEFGSKAVLITARNLEHEKKKRKKQKQPSLEDEISRKFVALETDIDDDYVLVKINPAGLKKAAENAENCLYSNTRPNKKFPHKKRIRYTKRFAYYQVRDRQNNAVATITLDFNRLQYRYEGNKQLSLAEKYWPLVNAWEKYFDNKYPEFNQNRPYGTLPRFTTS